MRTTRTSRRKFLLTASVVAAGSVVYGLDIPFEAKKKKSKEEIYKQLDELVDKYLPVYGACSQTSFIALNETFKLKADVIVKALASFPGVALRGETCGAVTGSLMGIALVYETDKMDNKVMQRASFKPSSTFCSLFEDEFGSTRCRDVVRHTTGKEYTVEKPEDYQILSRDGALVHCSEVIKKAIHNAADIIIEKL